jgi:hypothetical protein
LTFIKRFLKIDSSLKIDVGGIIQGVLLMFSANSKASFIVIIGSSIAITSGSINATTSG